MPSFSSTKSNVGHRQVTAAGQIAASCDLPDWFICMRILFSLPALIVVLLGVSPARAELRLPSILSDHAVLQADMPARIWGTADQGSHITVTFRSADLKTETDAWGRWMVWLPPQASGTEGDLTISSGSEQRTLHDVLFGEVWLAAGQSNMERSLHFSQDHEEVASRAAKAGFRFFIVQHAVADESAFDAKGHWEIADAKNVDHFSATACSFAIELSKRRHRPVGIVDSSFGGTRLQAWTSQATIESDARLAYVRDGWIRNLAELPALRIAYHDALQKWMASLSHEDQERAATGAAVPGRPNEPMGPGSKLQPAGLYNGMIAPLTPFTIRGILWYQGENDAGDVANAYQYRFLFQAMIQSWRRSWGDDALPFLFVQLARYHGLTYPLVRESQAKGLTLAHTAMIVSIDQGTSEDVHYPDKEIVGARLERAAEEVAYDEPGAYVPLQPVRVTGDGQALRVWFSPLGLAPQIKIAPVPYFAPATPSDAPHVIDGRTVRERQPTAEELQQAAQIAGPDGVFSPATMRVDGGSIAFASSAVMHPTQVCYAWSDAAPAILLWSRGGLPVTPFRLSLDPSVEPACPQVPYTPSVVAPR